jgi:hypothetical protein
VVADNGVHGESVQCTAYLDHILPNVISGSPLRS